MHPQEYIQMKKTITILLALFVCLPGSAFHDMLIILLIAWIWRKQWIPKLNMRWKYGARSVWGAMIALTLLLMPRPFALPTDRVQLIYFNDKGEQVTPPMSHWIWNLLFPEETMTAIASVVPMTPLRSALPLGEGILKDFDIELKSGKMMKVGSPYRANNFALESPMSGLVPQGFHEIFGGEERAVYMIRPRNFDKNKEYPVLFFAHGYLGNWKLYTGMLRGIKDHIVVCMGTEDWSGIFTDRHIREIESLYIPMLEKKGYKVDKNAISLMGLSNGGSAVDVAYSGHANKFKNLIYVSTGVNNFHSTTAKVMVIGGGVDHCAPSMKNGMRKLADNGQKRAFLFDEDHTHLKMLSDMGNCVEFLNREL